AANAYRQTQLGAPGFGFLQAMDHQSFIDAQYWGVHAEVNLETPIGDITFIPAYRETDSYSDFYGPAFNNAVFDEHYEQYSAELRLAGSAGMVDYIVGGFYFNEDVAGNNEFNQEFVLPIQSFVGGTESWAGFGQLTFNVTDQFRITGGLRYTEDQKFIDGNITNFITFCGPNSPPPVTPPASFGVGCQLDGALPRYPSFLQPQDALDWLIANGWVDAGSTLNQLPPFYPVLSQVAGDPAGTVRGRILRSVSAPTDSGTFDKLTWRVGVEYDVTPDNLLYATVETGYRAGGFQLAEAYTNYDPETITAYTLGSKNRFLNDRLQVNLEAFWWDYRDQQINFFTVSPDGVLVSVAQNVGASRIRGFDADVIAQPFRGTTLNAKVQYLDTQYQGLIFRTAPPHNNFNCPFTVNGTLNDGVTPVMEFDCSGNPALFSPKWSINFGAEQVVPLGGDFEAVLSARTAYQTQQWGNFNYLDFQSIPGYWRSDAQIEVRNEEMGWSIAGFVNNIEDHRQVAFPQASPIGFAVVRRNAPRTYGIRLSADF
ncbi:MAG: TonB-dependent receptor, partial [Erythrobacter sp.]|nr:TonB-dependent receptor [Erythrobacter sp.]